MDIVIAVVFFVVIVPVWISLIIWLIKFAYRK